MNKIIFSEGGQPVFLDDIKLIQDNAFSISTSIILGLVGRGNNVFLLHPYTFSTEIIDENNGIVRLTVHSNSIVVNGEVIDFASTSFLNTEIAEKGVAHVCIKRNKEDVRTFEDGQDKCCIGSTTAYLSLDTTGADEAYDITKLNSLIELLGIRLGIPVVAAWTDVPVIFYNGFTGSVRYKLKSGSVQLNINISSEQKSWDEPGPGILFKIADYTLIDILSDVGTNGIVGVPVDENGDLVGYGSMVRVYEDGYCRIVNRMSNGNLAGGYIPPCAASSEKGVINITLTK